MSEHLVNPRRAPRANVRCRARLQPDGAGAFDTETEDVGSHGCQIVAPGPVPRGRRVRVGLVHARVSSPLRLDGVVAWSSAQAPWRLGIAFDEAAQPAAARWFEVLVANAPGLSPYRRVPDRIPLDATVYLGAPPRFLADFTPGEESVLRAVGGGSAISALRAKLGTSWTEGQRSLFSLLARSHLTLTRATAVHPTAWREVLPGMADAAPAAPQRREPPPVLQRAMTGTTPASIWSSSVTPASAPGPAATPTPLPTPTATPAPSAPPAPTPAPTAANARAGASADFEGAGVGWRAPRGPRPAMAQECLDLARAEVAAGRNNAALALLRRALQLSPGDAEIAGELGKLAYR